MYSLLSLSPDDATKLSTKRCVGFHDITDFEQHLRFEVIFPQLIIVRLIHPIKISIVLNPH